MADTSVEAKLRRIVANRTGPFDPVFEEETAEDAIATIASQAQTIAALRSALESVMVGGNHLANMLIGQIGAGFAESFPPDMDHETALRQLCATDAYAVWCCWRAMMNARAALSQQEKG